MGSVNFIFFSTFIFVLLSPSVKGDQNDTNGYFLLNFKALHDYCFLDCHDKVWTWYINDLKFQLYSNEDPCNNRTSDVNESKISSLRDEIIEKWFHNDTNWSINSVWKNSGSCSLRIPELNDEFKYFKMALELAEKYNFNKVPVDARKQLESEEFKNKSVRGIEIAYDDISQEVKLYTNQIYLFLDKSFNLVNVDQIPENKIPKIPYSYL